jgi:hypothetical protein
MENPTQTSVNGIVSPVYRLSIRFHQCRTACRCCPSPAAAKEKFFSRIFFVFISPFGRLSPAVCSGLFHAYGDIIDIHHFYFYFLFLDESGLRLT